MFSLALWASLNNLGFLIFSKAFLPDMRLPVKPVPCCCAGLNGVAFSPLLHSLGSSSPALGIFSKTLMKLSVLTYPNNFKKITVRSVGGGLKVPPSEANGGGGDSQQPLLITLGVSAKVYSADTSSFPPHTLSQLH